MYKLSKDIKYKLASKDKSSEDFYILNADFLNQIKMIYNYKGISEEVQKINYISENEFKNKIPGLINLIRQKEIIKEIVPLDDMKIVPIIEELYSEKHFVNFGLVNERMYGLVEQIKNFFGLEGKLNPIPNTFYFTPQLFYKGKDYIKIGILNDEDVFEMHYYIKLDLYQTNLLSMVHELKGSKSAHEFFKSKKIDIDSEEIHELTDYRRYKIGKIINFIFKEQSKFPTEITKSKRTENTNINIKKLTIIPKKPNDSFKNFNTSNRTSDVSSNLSYLDQCNIKSFKEITYPPMIGLKNIGQTCYMNAALQCFSNTRALTSYFLNSKKLDIIKNNTIIINELDEPSLVIEYLKLIRHLWCDPPKSFYAPLEFKEKIGKIDPLFKNFEANDAKDFVNFMVMRMHEELNGADNSLLKQANLVEPPMPINPYNQQQVLQSYLYEFQINFNSFISNCFYGTTQGEFECQNCKMRLYQSGQNMPLIKYNYQTFFFLNFPLDEVRKFILSNQMLYTKYMNSRVNPNDVVDLIDCFYYHQKDELLDCYCERCQSSNAKVISRTRLFVAPSYLIIILNRGKGRQFNIKINFPEEFDTNGIFINPSGIFQLYAVVKHFGESGSSGHFTAYCRSPIDNCWYFYNDDMVSPVGPQDMYQIRDIGLTYMLFYQKKK
jgi:ubiquitin C-terminal hydrolase